MLVLSMWIKKAQTLGGCNQKSKIGVSVALYILRIMYHICNLSFFPQTHI